MPWRPWAVEPVPVYPIFLPYAGCRYRCRFCRQPTGELPDPGLIASRLNEVLPAHGEGEVAFYGGSFTLLPASVQNSCLSAVTPFRQAGRMDGVRISTRPDAVSADAARRLRRLGVTTVELGCQSFSTEVLALSQRGHGPDAPRQAVEHLRRSGLRVGLQLMPGLPGGDRQEAIESLRAALDLHPDFLRIYPTVVFRRTALEADWLSGGYHPWSLEEAVDCCAEMFWRCRGAGVPVIRIGLQDEAGLADQVAAGPWHPAFGQLVRSRLWLLAIIRSVRATAGKSVAVAAADLGDALGHRRENLRRLQQDFGAFEIAGAPDLPRQGLAVGGRPFNLWQMDLYGEI